MFGQLLALFCFPLSLFALCFQSLKEVAEVKFFRYLSNPFSKMEVFCFLVKMTGMFFRMSAVFLGP